MAVGDVTNPSVGTGGVGSAVSSGEGGSLGTRLGRAHRGETEACFSLETFEMFYIGQRVVCIDDKFLGENGVFGPSLPSAVLIFR